MTSERLALHDSIVGLPQLFDNLARDFVLLILGQLAAHSVAQAETITESHDDR
jgi:hypothetical protein